MHTKPHLPDVHTALFLTCPSVAFCAFLLQVYSSTVMACVRARCLGTITKLLAVGSPQQLQEVLADLPISSFVASLLTSRDLKAQAAAIQMAELLMAKLPQVFAGFFVKEGVAHALEQLAATAADGAAADGLRARSSSELPRAASGAAAAGVEGRRPSGSGASLPPPSPPLTRSRRSSKAGDQVCLSRQLSKTCSLLAAASVGCASCCSMFLMTQLNPDLQSWLVAVFRALESHF